MRLPAGHIAWPYVHRRARLRAVRRPDAFGPLAERRFRRLWLASTTSAVGSAFVPVALAFAVLGIGGSATSLGLVLLTGTLAGLLAFLAGGVWADRYSRRNLM